MRKRVRRSTASVETAAARALAYIRGHDGCSVGDIASALRLTTKDLQLPIKKLLADKKVRTTGQRRGTRYHVRKARGPARKKATRRKVAKRKTTKKRRVAKKARRKTAKRRGKKKATTKRKTTRGKAA